MSTNTGIGARAKRSAVTMRFVSLSMKAWTEAKSWWVKYRTKTSVPRNAGFKIDRLSFCLVDMLRLSLFGRMMRLKSAGVERKIPLGRLLPGSIFSMFLMEMIGNWTPVTYRCVSVGGGSFLGWGG